MKRPHFHPSKCKVCGSESDISQQGLCPVCGFERFAANIDQLRDKHGPFYEHWARRGLLAYRRALVATHETER